ncbi:hypothetical protein AQ621_17130 (plasmid) [Marinobacter sp. P4B1]|nr:hypothetical protein AQ621_17130 [Marinobacter sp. P4B1]
MLLVCFVGAVGTLLMGAAIWYFEGGLDVAQRSLMFLLGLSTNASAVVFIVWKTGLFTRGDVASPESSETK